MFPPRLTELAAVVLNEAKSNGLHIATAESCTGGLIAGLLTEIPGSSDVVDRGFVTYSYEAKEAMLGVPMPLIVQDGAVSEAVARAMVTGALAHSNAELAVAVTGIAGPGGGSAEKPVGLVHMAAARKDGPVLHEEHRFGDIGRGMVRLKTVEAALRLLLQLL
jgi:competence/damage-inducible protein CinA C-terminal domain